MAAWVSIGTLSFSTAKNASARDEDVWGMIINSLHVLRIMTHSYSDMKSCNRHDMRQCFTGALQSDSSVVTTPDAAGICFTLTVLSEYLGWTHMSNGQAGLYDAV